MKIATNMKVVLFLQDFELQGHRVWGIPCSSNLLKGLQAPWHKGVDPVFGLDGRVIIRVCGKHEPERA